MPTDITVPNKGTPTGKVYRIKTIEDINMIPSDRLHQFLAELEAGILECKKDNEDWGLFFKDGVMVWVDDGYGVVTVYLEGEDFDVY